MPWIFWTLIIQSYKKKTSQFLDQMKKKKHFHLYVFSSNIWIFNLYLEIVEYSYNSGFQISSQIFLISAAQLRFSFLRWEVCCAPHSCPANHQPEIPKFLKKVFFIFLGNLLHSQPSISDSTLKYVSHFSHPKIKKATRFLHYTCEF